MKNILIAICLFNLLAVFTDLDYQFLAHILGLTSHIAITPEELPGLIDKYNGEVVDYLYGLYKTNGTLDFTLEETYDLFRKAINEAIVHSNLPMEPGSVDKFFNPMKQLVTDLHDSMQR